MRASAQHHIDSSYYGVEEGELYSARDPLPGYRFEYVSSSGNIGYYGPDGSTPIAGCALQRYRHAGALQFLLPPVHALHNPLCSCGHRIMRSLPELAHFVHVAVESHGWHSLYASVPTIAIVECRVPAGAVVTAGYRADVNRLGSVGDQPGTLRTDQLELGKTVWLPRHGTRTQQRAMAKTIRERYPDVRVRQPDTDVLAFINSLAPTGEPGDYGTGGVLFTSGPPLDPLYLLRNDGKRWDIPAAERRAREAPLAAATRAAESIGLQLAASPVAGAARGDRFTVFLAYLEDPAPVDGMEWITRKELWAHVVSGDVAPRLTMKLQQIERLRHRAWNNTNDTGE